MEELFTQRAQLVLEIAQDEAKKFKHQSVSSEHILLSLVIGGGLGRSPKSDWLLNRMELLGKYYVKLD